MYKLGGFNYRLIVYIYIYNILLYIGERMTQSKSNDTEQKILFVLQRYPFLSNHTLYVITIGKGRYEQCLIKIWLYLLTA